MPHYTRCISGHTSRKVVYTVYNSLSVILCFNMSYSRHYIPVFPLSTTGHSHQLFHVCGISGTHFQMLAIEMDMGLRRSWLHDHAPAITFRGTVGAITLSSVISLGIICFFSYPLFSSTAQGKATRKASSASKKNWNHQPQLSESSQEVWHWSTEGLQ